MYLEIFLKQEPFFLLPQRALFRPRYRQLVFGDIHLGKAMHFQKKGIPVPPQSHLKDIDAIHYLLNTWKPDTVLILGDLFHSAYNSEWLWFKSVLMEYPKVQFVLVEGNHDIMREEVYDIPNLLKVRQIEELDFIFTHQPLDDPKKLNICGHVHPGIRLQGTTRQSIKLPYFYKGQKHFILPAFGHLTELQLLDREENSDYYLVMDNQVMKL